MNKNKDNIVYNIRTFLCSSICFLSFLNSFDFNGRLEFDIHPNLIPTKNWEGLPPQPSRYYHFTSITRIRINLAKEKIIEYKKSQIINFAIEMPRQDLKIKSKVKQEVDDLTN